MTLFGVGEEAPPALVPDRFGAGRFTRGGGPHHPWQVAVTPNKVAVCRPGETAPGGHRHGVFVGSL